MARVNDALARKRCVNDYAYGIALILAVKEIDFGEMALLSSHFFSSNVETITHLHQIVRLQNEKEVFS